MCCIVVFVIIFVCFYFFVIGWCCFYSDMERMMGFCINFWIGWCWCFFVLMFCVVSCILFIGSGGKIICVCC